VFVCDEVASSITQCGATSGALIGGVTVPTIYASANVQSNMGLESLAFGSVAAPSFPTFARGSTAWM
jgi:hypothetical protein